MTLLAEHAWKLKYTPDDGDLIRLFYVPALEDAVRYDRLTGYFSADALTLAARGIEGLLRNDGRMRLVVGCTLDPDEVAAIERGEKLRGLVEQHLSHVPLDPPDAKAKGSLEMLAWMVAKGYLDVKVAVPCDHQRRPIPSNAIFHEKSGIIEDKTGDNIAWTGSLNETAMGWKGNWETINVYRGWTPDRERVVAEEENFARIWADKSQRVITLDVPAAVKQDLMRFLPKDDGMPARLEPKGAAAPDVPILPPVEEPTVTPLASEPLIDKRRLVWSFIHHAASLPNGGERVGEATCAVDPWPHQIRAFARLYERWPPKLLIADEVGLGKTIQAGMLLRQAWLAGKAKRILILAPKAVLRQWQLELREKFNLNWPIYDGQKLVRYRSPALQQGWEKLASREAWHREPVVIASSQLMRRQDRARDLVEAAEPWDLIVLDEAHHARRRAAGTSNENRPNALLRLMLQLRTRTQGLVLMTATPMQVHPVEVWDLLSLLGLPPEWHERAFLRFFELAEQPNPDAKTLDELAALFQAGERHFGPVAVEDAMRLCGGSKLKAGKLLRALRDPASIPRRQLETADRKSALQLMQASTPVRRLISRHTRELLRRYYKAGMISTPIADREVDDRFIDMSPAEAALYGEVEDYIETTYDQAGENERSAVGFVMTIYRRRLASSFLALRRTLESHLAEITGEDGRELMARAEEDAPDDEAEDEQLDADEVAEREREALQVAERADIETLLASIRVLPPDSKLECLEKVVGEVRGAGYSQIMVFTQYTDTMDFLRQEMRRRSPLRLMCFSGRGGEVPQADGSWRSISREDVKRRFRDGEADLLLCTDAAAEGLNFQFCGAVVNYDMPWNPMRVEQRIGRIDRLGQKHPKIRIVNLHYRGTVETDVYMALRGRIRLFEQVVGRLQPILSRMTKVISETVLRKGGRDEQARANMIAGLEEEAIQAASGGFDIDAVTDADLTLPPRAEPNLTLAHLARVLNTPSLLPPGIAAAPLGNRDYSYSWPGMDESVRTTTEAAFFEEHPESVELWSPGSPAFPTPDGLLDVVELPAGATLEQLLSR